MSYIEYTSIHTNLLNYLNIDFLNYSNNAVLPVLFLNIGVYVCMLMQIFLVFFMFDTSYLRTINELKFVSIFKKCSIPVLTAILSMAGIPPLMGFCTKFVLFILIVERVNYFFIFFFSFFNMFAMYFYIQNFRHLVTNKLYKNFYIWDVSFDNYTFTILIQSIQFLNVFFVFIFEDFLFYTYPSIFFILL